MRRRKVAARSESTHRVRAELELSWSRVDRALSLLTEPLIEPFEPLDRAVQAMLTVDQSNVDFDR